MKKPPNATVKDPETGEWIQERKFTWDKRLKQIVKVDSDATGSPEIEFYSWPADVIDRFIRSTKRAEMAVLARLHELWVLRNGKNPIALSNHGLRGITSGSKWRALESLAESGLVLVEKRDGCSPLVTMTWKKLK